MDAAILALVNQALQYTGVTGFTLAVIILLVLKLLPNVNILDRWAKTVNVFLLRIRDADKSRQQLAHMKQQLKNELEQKEAALKVRQETFPIEIATRLLDHILKAFDHKKQLQEMQLEIDSLRRQLHELQNNKDKTDFR